MSDKLLITAPLTVVLLLASCERAEDRSGADPAPGAVTGGPAQTPSDTVGGEGAKAVLRFRIEDESGAAIPGRLTFVAGDGSHPELFANPAAKPDDLAVRVNAVYTLSGDGAITVPPGRYRVYGSRGLEWSIDDAELAFVAGETTTWTAQLRHEVDTSGWVSGDFHLHTLTHSGHGDSNMNERIISCIGEGLEIAVATDHNHHTDYVPTIEDLGAEDRLLPVMGNEVSTSIGHFNVFPVAAGKPLEHRLPEAAPLFQGFREHDNGLGFVPVIQVNHPRWTGIDYFAHGGVDPVTGRTDSEVYAPDFDAIEILNENEGWGWQDAETTDVPVGSSRHHVLRDWFNLLDHGHPATGVGNSDSHHVYDEYAAYPRNFISSGTDDPTAVDPRDLAEAIRAGELFTTTGPFLRWTANGAGMGAEVVAEGGHVDVEVEIQAASWIDCDRLSVIVNGDVAAEAAIPATESSVRLARTIPLELTEDAWIILVVEGDEPLAPIVDRTKRPILPLAITNPIRVDADGDGRFTPPWFRLTALVRAAGSPREILDAMAAMAPSGRGLLVLASAERPEYAAPVVESALTDSDRRVRLCAARAAEQLGDPSFAPGLQALLADEGADAYLAMAALRALAAIDPDGRTAAIETYLDRHGSPAIGRYHEELEDLLPGRWLTRWSVAGYFDNPAPDAVLTTTYAPETDADPSAEFTGMGGAAVAWRAASARDDGWLSLLQLMRNPRTAEQAIAYAQTWIHSDEPRRVVYAMGSDDGCRVFLNGEPIHDDASRHPATPMQHVGRLDLDAGWNRLLVKVENGGGNFGLYFRVFDEDVEHADQPK